MEKLKKRQSYIGVDIVKFICAILVIGIHTQPFEFNFILDKGYGMISRLAVPFFFYHLVISYLVKGLAISI